MKPSLKFLVPVFCFLLFISGCAKEGSSSGGNNGNCNANVNRLKKVQATFDDEHYVEASWNGDGTINTLKVNVPLSDYRTAKYIYSGGRITQAALISNYDDQVFDTVVFRYNSDGKVDSMYRKGDDYFGLRLTWTSGKLTKLSRYDGPGSGIMYYWDIVTDGNGNITKADEYWNDNGTFKKESTYTYTRDTRKNPLSGVAPYMLYLNDEYEIFRDWGPNNMIDQRYQDFTGNGIDLTTGHKYKYDGNCYPASAQNTIEGQVIFNDDDFIFTYW